MHKQNSVNAHERKHGRDPRLVESFRNPLHVAGMMHHVGADVGTEVIEGKHFPCILQPRVKKARAVLLRGRSGAFMYATYIGHRRPLLLTLGEVLANVRHGFRWPDTRLQHQPVLLGLYGARLATASTIVYPRHTLPSLPRNISMQLNDSELCYACALVEAFAVRLDLAREFTPHAFRASLGHIMFSRNFRRHWISTEWRTGISIRRQDAIWSLLVREQYVIAIPLPQLRRVVYRFASSVGRLQLPTLGSLLCWSL